MNENSLKTLIVIEDDSVMRAIVVKEAQMQGFKILEAEDGQKGLEIIQKQKPSLVILDLLLPKMDGFQVLESVRKSPDQGVANIPVVILSNLWSNKDILRTEALKIDAYFVKANTTMQEVMAKIIEILGKKPEEKVI